MFSKEFQFSSAACTIDNSEGVVDAILCCDKENCSARIFIQLLSSEFRRSDCTFVVELFAPGSILICDSHDFLSSSTRATILFCTHAIFQAPLQVAVSYHEAGIYHLQLGAEPTFPAILPVMR